MKEINRLVTVWQPRLGLSGWDILTMVGDMDDETARMEIDMSNQYENAVIHVAEWLLRDEPPAKTMFAHMPMDSETLQQTVVHELLHCVFRDIKQLVQEVIDGQLQRDADIIFCRVFDRVEEATIDRLATALVKAWGTGGS